MSDEPSVFADTEEGDTDVLEDGRLAVGHGSSRNSR